MSLKSKIQGTKRFRRYTTINPVNKDSKVHNKTIVADGNIYLERMRADTLGMAPQKK